MKRAVVSLDFQATTVDFRFDTRDSRDPADWYVVEVLAYRDGCRIPASDPIYDLLNAIIERDVFNPLGAKDKLLELREIARESSVCVDEFAELLSDGTRAYRVGDALVIDRQLAKHALKGGVSN